MIVVFDTTTLLVAIAPPEKVKVAIRGAPILDARKRIDHLIDTLDRQEAKVLIPTPALSEALSQMEPQRAEAIVKRLDALSVFKVASFDAPAALEAASMTFSARKAGDKKGGAVGGWQKVKVDRQIVAIAKVHGAEAIYSNDDDIRALAPAAGLRLVGIEELPLPPASIAPPTPPLLEQMERRDGEEAGPSGEA